MNEIYNILATLRDAYIGIALQFTNKKYEAEDAVQELYIYLLNMNKETLQKIYKSDGKIGLIRYGAVALRRSFTSPRSKRELIIWYMKLARQRHGSILRK